MYYSEIEPLDGESSVKEFSDARFFSVPDEIADMKTWTSPLYRHSIKDFGRSLETLVTISFSSHRRKKSRVCFDTVVASRSKIPIKSCVLIDTSLPRCRYMSVCVHLRLSAVIE